MVEERLFSKTDIILVRDESLLIPTYSVVMDPLMDPHASGLAV